MLAVTTSRAAASLAAASASSASRGSAQPARLPARLVRKPRGAAAALSRGVRAVASAARPVVAAVAAEADTLPTGYVRYETMLILRPNITDQERDRELAKFEVFLKNEEAIEINAMVRGRQRMAYPMQGHWEGIYVLYTYAAKRQTSQGVQRLLSKPDIESEGYLLRFMTFVV